MESLAKLNVTLRNLIVLSQVRAKRGPFAYFAFFAVTTQLLGVSEENKPDFLRLNRIIDHIWMHQSYASAAFVFCKFNHSVALFSMME